MSNHQPSKKVEIQITAYYLYAWIFTIVGFLCLYKSWNILGGILLFFAFSFSVSDITNPPPDINNNGPKAV